MINPHKLGVHKVLQHIPLNALFDAPSKARLRKAVNIADLRLCAKQRAHKVSFVPFIIISGTPHQKLLMLTFYFLAIYRFKTDGL